MTCNREAVRSLLCLPMVDEISFLPVIWMLFGLLPAKMALHKLGQQEKACSLPRYPFGDLNLS